jgi:hypothetical protein
MAKRTTSRHEAGLWEQWTEAEARAALEEFAASGESAAGFARRKGISAGRMAYWRKRLSAGATPAFVPVTVPSVSSPRWLEIRSAGVVVRVREDLDVEHVARLVEALGRRRGGAC